MKNERTEASERSETDDAANKPNATATAPFRERVQAFPFDSLRRRLPVRRENIETGGRGVGSISQKEKSLNDVERRR